MNKEEIIEYISTQKNNGYSEFEIRKVLLENNYSNELIDSLFLELSKLDLENKDETQDKSRNDTNLNEINASSSDELDSTDRFILRYLFPNFELTYFTQLLVLVIYSIIIFPELQNELIYGFLVIETFRDRVLFLVVTVFPILIALSYVILILSKNISYLENSLIRLTVTRGSILFIPIVYFMIIFFHMDTYSYEMSFGINFLIIVLHYIFIFLAAISLRSMFLEGFATTTKIPNEVTSQEKITGFKVTHRKVDYKLVAISSIGVIIYIHIADLVIGFNEVSSILFSALLLIHFQYLITLSLGKETV